MEQKIYRSCKNMLIYSFLAIIIGTLTGAVDAFFGEVLILITETRDKNPMRLIPFLPLAGILIMFLYKKLSEESLKGMTMVFQAGHGELDQIPKMLIPLVIFSTWLTHLFGGSAGREGVAVQLGATIAHTIGKCFKSIADPRILLITGMAAGFAGLFQTPLAATFFAIEVLTSGVIMSEALLPALLASYTASMTSHFLGLEKFSVNINLGNAFSPSLSFFAKIALTAVIFGITGGGFAHFLGFCKKYFAERIGNPMKRIFFMGCGISALLLLLHMGRYGGLGTNLIQKSFQGSPIYSYDWILKLLLTVLTLSAGYQGGEVTPVFSIGASLGVILGAILNLPAAFTAALGYAAVFGSATNTLFAPILIGAEIFGPQNTIYFAFVCAIAYVFNGNKTIYAAQKKFNSF